MTNTIQMLDVVWGGPYSWPGFEEANLLAGIPKIPGVYIMTFEYKNGYLIYGVGITGRPVPERFREHSRKYRKGEYTVLNAASALRGVRQEVWHGWGYARQHREEFEDNKAIILKAVELQLGKFRIFTADVKGITRARERIEAAIMNNLYTQLPPLGDFPDKGMQLSPRWDSEELVVSRNQCTEKLYGLPLLLEI